MNEVKNKVIVEIASSYKPDDLGVMQLMISAVNHDGAKVQRVENISVSDINPHIVLFAKGYYRRGKTENEDIEILKEILAEYSGTPMEYMHLFQCFFWVSETAGKLLSLHQVIRSMQEIHVKDTTPLPLKIKYVKNNDACVSVYSLIQSFLSEICILTVDQIPNWDAVKSAKYQKWSVK